MVDMSEHTLAHEFAAEPGSKLSVHGHSGDVQVKASPEPTIRVQATGFDPDECGTDEPLAFEPTDDGLKIGFSHGCQCLDLDLAISVPTGCEVHVRTLDGDVSVTGTEAPVDVDTVDGSVSVESAGETCTVKTRIGDISVTSLQGEIALTSIDGDVRARDLTGALRLKATNGDVGMDACALRAVDAEAINGQLTVNTSLSAGGRYALKTVNGDVRLGIPPESRATVRMKTQQGDIRTDIPADVHVIEKRKWHGELNGGGAQVRLESVNGDLRVSRWSGRETESDYRAEHEHRHHDAPIPPIPPIPPTNPSPHVFEVPPIPPVAPIPRMPSTPHSFDDSHVSAFENIGDDHPDGRHAASAPEAGVGRNDQTVAILAQLERGEISVDDAMESLDRLG